MTLHSIPVLVLASVSALVGIFFLYIFLKNRRYRSAGIFSLICFSVTLYDISCIGIYNNTTSLEISVEWGRLQYVAIAFTTITLSYFYHQLTGRLSRKALILIVITNILFILAGYTIRNNLTLTPDITLEKIISIGDLVTVRYLEGMPGIIYILQSVFSLIVYTVCIFGLISFQRKSEQDTLPLVVSIIIFYFAGMNDFLVSIGVYPFVYLFEYAFMAIIISMAMSLVNDFLNLYDKVENINITLEKKIEERTQELKILSGLLPICSSCKNVRDDQGYWNQIESYISQHSEAEFSHSLCPKCAKKLYPELGLSKKK